MLPMIPISLPSVNFYLLLLLGLIAGVVLAAWGLLLAFSPGHRRTVRKHWKKSAALFVVLAVPFAFFAWVHTIVWQIERESERAEAARHVTLEHAATLGGVAMPAGTRLTLQDEGQLDTYVEAEFPTPTAIFGVQAKRARRYLDTEYEKDTYALVRRYPRSIILTGEGDQDVQGWRCDSTHDIEFDTEPDGAMKALSQCQLGRGNTIDGIAIQAGSVLYGSNGTVYVDGSRDPDRWRVEIKDPVAVKVFGLMLSEPRLYLDADRHLLRVSDAELACRARLGAFDYAEGTQVKTVRRVKDGQREPFPGVLVFSPSAGQVARHEGHADVPEGMSVMQAFDGTLAGVVTNDEVGVFKFATFVVGNEEPKAAARARCP
ncbi:hypothetical protein [Achromobacter piechaudii]|uniref:Uncharacterized protein n=2 Tax=Achromobacter piechaudii TaxID=72556 RepID=A0ABM8L079_9BURK|nr:hypothetical protein [Achromobacter piechaudii]CAB3718038.1 hypothetical protein LMG1873_03678 [Achromobacter piechaudii]CAB3886552.1 hypothetical protein LMG2828_03762 [Achromobacter piechaudii]CAB3952016.1 hypothetical protein LMG6103_03262 [Achromobacter piechaudii]